MGINYPNLILRSYKQWGIVAQQVNLKAVGIADSEKH